MKHLLLISTCIQLLLTGTPPAVAQLRVPVKALNQEQAKKLVRENPNPRTLRVQGISAFGKTFDTDLPPVPITETLIDEEAKKIVASRPIRISSEAVRKILREDLSRITTPEFNPSTMNRVLVSTQPQLRADASYIPGSPDSLPVVRLNGFLAAKLMNNEFADLFNDTRVLPNVKAGVQAHLDITRFRRWFGRAVLKLKEDDLPAYSFVFDNGEAASLFLERQDSLNQTQARERRRVGNRASSVAYDVDALRAQIEVKSMAVARQYRRLNSLPAPGNDLEKQAAIDSVNALIATLEKEKIQLDEKLKDNLLEMALAKKSNREQSEVRDDQRTALEMQAPFRYRRHQWLTFDWNFNGQEYYLFNADPKIPSGKQLEYISFAGRNHAIRYNRVQFGKDLSFYGSLAYAWGNANNAEELSILKIKSQQTFTSRITTSTKTGTSTIRDSTFVADTTNQPNRDVQALMKGDYETFSYQELNAQLIFFSENRAWGLDVQAAHRWLAGEGLSGKTTTSLGIGLIGSAINMTNKNAKFSAELLVTFRDLNNANPFNLKDVPREWYNRRTVTFRLSVPFPRQN